MTGDTLSNGGAFRQINIIYDIQFESDKSD